MPNRVLVVVKGYPRLSETFIAQELLSLERAGFTLDIVSLRRPTDTRVHTVHEQITAKVTYLPEYLREAPWRVLGALLKLAVNGRLFAGLAAFAADFRRDASRGRIRRFGQAAVLAAEMPEDTGFLYAHFIHSPASVAQYASLMSGIAWGCSAHAKDIWTTPDDELRRKLAAVTFAVTCTKAGLARLNALAPPSRPAKLIYHGLDRSRLRRMTAPMGERDGHDPTKPVRLLTVARAVEKKGIDTLIAALALLPADLAWSWSHMGGGGLVGQLTSLAEQHGIAHRCSFMGARTQAEVFAAYAVTDLFVLPCRVAGDGDRDGLPNVLMEAASMGVALVSTPVSGVVELIEDGVTGALVPPDDPLLLAAALERLIRDPQTRFRLGREAARRVERDFVHEDTIIDLLALFPEPVRAGTRPVMKEGSAA